jgi:hypothetical protein
VTRQHHLAAGLVPHAQQGPLGIALKMGWAAAGAQCRDQFGRPEMLVKVGSHRGR